MAVKIIPAKRLVICDACQRSDQPRKIEAVLKFIGAALDMVGAPVANAEWTRDYCDACWRRISSAIQDAECQVQVKQAEDSK